MLQGAQGRSAQVRKDTIQRSPRLCSWGRPGPAPTTASSAIWGAGPPKPIHYARPCLGCQRTEGYVSTKVRVSNVHCCEKRTAGHLPQ